MNSKSTKQRAKDKAIGKIRETREKTCVLCGRPASEMCHLLPKSLWMEHYTNPDNLVIMCRSCHTLHDDNIEFRSTQEKLFKQALKVDELGAKRYYKRKSPTISFQNEPNFEWLGDDEVIMEKSVVILYDNYEIECRITATGEVKEHKGDYDNPHTYEVVHVSVEVSCIQAFDTENSVVDLPLEEYRKIKIDITNFIKENL